MYKSDPFNSLAMSKNKDSLFDKEMPVGENVGSVVIDVVDNGVDETILILILNDSKADRLKNDVDVTRQSEKKTENMKNEKNDEEEDREEKETS